MEAVGPGWIAYVNFSYNGVRIATGDFLRVRRAVEKDLVEIDVGPLSPDTGAQYFYLENRFLFEKYDFGLNPFHKGTIAHEATHCILDIKKSRLLAVEQELVAYIAEQAYLTPFWTTKKFGVDDTTPQGIAREIVRSMWRNDPTHLRPSVPSLSSRMPEIEALAQVILADPAYKNLRAQPTAIYMNDGVSGA